MSDPTTLTAARGACGGVAAEGNSRDELRKILLELLSQTLDEVESGVPRVESHSGVTFVGSCARGSGGFSAVS